MGNGIDVNLAKGVTAVTDANYFVVGTRYTYGCHRYFTTIS